MELKRETPTFTDYIEAEGKRLIQSRFIESIGVDFRSSILGLAGPNLLDYFSMYKLFLKKKGDMLISYELDEVTFEIQKNTRFYIDKNQDKIELNKGNIELASPERLIDLDLTHTWGTEEAMITHLFQKQYNMQIGIDEKRVFIVSVTTRNSSIDECILHLNDMLDIKLSTFRRGTPLINCKGEQMAKKYNLIGDSKEFSVELYTYRDNATMANFLIQY